MKLATTRREFVSLAGAAAVPADTPVTVPQMEYLTPFERVVILDKGKAQVGQLSAEGLRAAGLTPETWTLEMVADPASNSVIERPFARAQATALDWGALMKLAEQHAVRFLHVCVCTNGADPYHMTLWEGVPLRELVWLAGLKANIRRVYYQSYHREGVAPFQASLPLGQVLETPPGQQPVILAYKMNGQWIPPSLGGPVRMMVPGAYGSKQIKWVNRLVFTNDYKSNDSDAELNNDTESAMKTRARFVNPPKEARAGERLVIAGMAQVGISGLRAVEYSVRRVKSAGTEQWRKADLLPPPARWGGGLPEGRLPALTGQSGQWPLRYTIVHWAARLEALPEGSYELACRTIDGNGIAQPMPRPLLRTGFNAIHRVELTVRG